LRAGRKIRPEERHQAMDQSCGQPSEWRDEEEEEEEEVCSESVWNRREAARFRQIAIGKNRPEFKRNSHEVPLHLRDSSMPQTPDPRSRVSKRQFDRALSDWRRRLHEYEAVPHGCGGGSSPEGVMRLCLADRLPEPRTPSTTAGTSPSSSVGQHWSFSPSEMDQCQSLSPSSMMMFALQSGCEQDDRRPADIDQVYAASRFGSCPPPGHAWLAEPKSLTDIFNAAASPDRGCLPGRLQLSPGRGRQTARDSEAGPGNSTASRSGSPRTPSPRAPRLLGSAGRGAGGHKGGYWAGISRSPTASAVRTPKVGNWLTETPSPRGGSHWSYQAGRLDLQQQHQQHLPPLGLFDAQWYGGWQAQAMFDDQTAWNMDALNFMGLPLPGVDEGLASCSSFP